MTRQFLLYVIDRDGAKRSFEREAESEEQVRRAMLRELDVKVLAVVEL